MILLLTFSLANYKLLPSVLLLLLLLLLLLMLLVVLS